MTFGDHSAQLT